MPNPRRLALMAAAAAITVLSLAACAPAVPLHHHGPHPSAGSSSTSPSLTPTPTPVVVAPPVSRVPVSCEQLAPVAQVDSTIGLPLVASSGLYEVSDLDPYAFTQAGGIDCNYQTTHPDTDLGFYEVFVTPDIPSAKWTAYVPNISDFGVKPSPFGANSYLDCTASYHDAHCDLQMLVGSTLIYINDYSPAQPTESSTAAETHFLPLLKTAVNGVMGVTVAEPAWTDPNATAVNVPSSEAAVMSTVSTAVGFPVTSSISGPSQDPIPPRHDRCPRRRSTSEAMSATRRNTSSRSMSCRRVRGHGQASSPPRARNRSTQPFRAWATRR